MSPSRVIIALAVFGYSFSSCGKQEEEKSEHPPTPQQQSLTRAPVSGNAVAGIRWDVPSRWEPMPARQMRVATYSVPAVSGDPEDGECAVFFFGSGQGGDVAMNIDRWAGQFEENPKPVRSSRKVNNLNVTVVSLSGTYLAPGGPMMQSTGSKPNFKLLGAIVEGPEGAVFFKFTGPTKTVAAAEAEFNSLVSSIVKN